MEILTKKEQVELFERHFGELKREIEAINAKISMFQASEKMLNRAEVAKTLGISYHQVAKTPLNSTKIGSRFMYKQSDVLDYAEKINRLS